MTAALPPDIERAAVDADLQVFARLVNDFEFYAPRCLSIVDKITRNRKPFSFNAAQQQLHAEVEDQRGRLGYVRKIIVKGRQQGVSTYVTGRGYHRTSLTPNFNTFILTHEIPATQNLFAMVQAYHDGCPLKPVVGQDRNNKLTFSLLNSSYSLATARTRSAGRSLSIQFFHGSECSFWPAIKDNLAAIGQALPLAPGTEAFLETTANGQNEFHGIAMAAVKGESDYELTFIPWFLQLEYARDFAPEFPAQLDDDDWAYMETYGLSLRQMAWRAAKIRTDFSGDASLFDQEYPASLARAFSRTATQSPFILPVVVEAARKRDRSGEQNQGAEILGVDPSQGRNKNDRFAVIGRNRVRQTFKATLRTTNDDTMAAAAQIADIVVKRKPLAVFIDRLGLGAGVCDRLSELLEGSATRVIGVKASETSTDDQYFNKRTEMWGKERDWIADADIFDDNEIEADMTGPSFGFRGEGRMLLEPKEKMVKRGLPSPDFGDALAHTFYVPIELTANRSREDLRSGLSNWMLA